MSTKWLLSAAFLFSLSSSGQAAEFDFRQAGGDAQVRQLFASFMAFSGNRTDDLEHAAFMVRDGDGQLSCVQWPYANWERSRVYRAIPPGTVAIVRIHSWGEEKPSGEDVLQSAGSGLPVYILTRWYIYAVDPASGQKVPLVSRRDWSSDVSGSADVRCSTMKNWRTVHRVKTAAK